MNQLLKLGQTVQTRETGAECVVGQFLGGGGQGEVYEASMSGSPVALKWFFPHYLRQDTRLRDRLEQVVQAGPPSDRFLWPMDLATAVGRGDFGYVMPLREARFKGIVDLVTRRVSTDFRALTTAGFELAHSFLQLHAKGLCYRDISFGNVFFDPATGEVRICDNDNVDVNGQPGSIGGTARFMAPEIVQGNATPTTQTDLFSLAVLLFYMLMNHHPLEGAREAAIHCLDLPAMMRLYGTNPLFIFDPDDPSNRPVPGYHDNALALWPVYPQFIKDLFIRAFTDGIRDPEHGRVRESEWRAALVHLRDSIVYCPGCGAQNFYDPARLRSQGDPGLCWSCGAGLKLPPRIRLGRDVVMLNYDSQLFPHHVDERRRYDFSSPVARVVQHPDDPRIWGMKNVSQEKWVITDRDNSVKDVFPGQAVTLSPGIRIHFGQSEGAIRF